MFLIFDTETTGLPKNYSLDYSHTDNWPRLVQLAWQLHDETGKLLSNKNYIIKPEGFEIPFASIQIHKISNEIAHKYGHDLSFVLNEFLIDLKKSTYNVGHNISFDIDVLACEFFRLGDIKPQILEKLKIDTKEVSTDYCAISNSKTGRFKWPTLSELHQKLFGKAFDESHNAAYDVAATVRCFFELVKRNVYVPKEISNYQNIELQEPELEIPPYLLEKSEQETISSNTNETIVTLSEFTHLHVHSQFSVLQSTSNVKTLLKKAKLFNMKAIALTDHGNMMGAFVFNSEALEMDIKPILGCEFNVCKDRNNKSEKDDGYQIVFLAKNKNGYENIIKLASLANTEGFYYIPRIDKNLILQFKEDLIVLSGGLWGEIPNKILNQGDAAAEESVLWWKEHFGDDFYLELNRHNLDEENHVNNSLIALSKKHNIRLVATNNTYYTEQTEADAHDVLLCVKDNYLKSQPKKYFGKRGREFRFGFPNDNFYLKSQNEMSDLFSDLPQALEATQEIADKCEVYKLKRDVLLPKFDIPSEFLNDEDLKDGGKRGENAYLKHITFEGAKKRYPNLTKEIQERIDFELSIIEKTGYPGYFLIVEDFCREARKMGVSVGPGRGSAAGSVVAYCIEITNIDPIKYDLLFERFLNPDRVSLPDIDIDFDDEGRQKVIDYVINKYGEKRVSQIITYGSMAAKSVIRDTGRVLDIPLENVNAIAKLVPDAQGTELNKLFSMSDNELKEKYREDYENIQKLKNIATNGSDIEKEAIKLSLLLEGSVRNTGIHPCGVIITPDDLTNLVPVAMAKDTNMYCTQFDNSVVEKAGLLKMDFLGLKTLTLIKDTCKIVKQRHGIELNPDDFPLDDEKTIKLFQKGETTGIFQFESPGMKKYLKDLKPSDFSDLIAMNALYRPGPIEYIPAFIKRKLGIEPIEYDIDDQKEYLEETYGITVFQEQVMLLSQKLANFTKGEADQLRKAMGKKLDYLLKELEPKFFEGGKKNGHELEKLEKVWKDWQAFGNYAFNKSHSTCYSYVAFQTAYLKANYPAEYMAAVLSNNMGDLKQVTLFMDECKTMGIKVLGPDVNESKSDFFVNKEGDIRFGLNAIKGAGGIAVDDIISERDANGLFTDIWDFSKRVNLRTVNKKTFESLALAGAFDSFGIERSCYFYTNEIDYKNPLIEVCLKYGQKQKIAKESMQSSLFGGGDSFEEPTPKIPDCEPWSPFHQLKLEKDVVGVYISAHPLDEYKYECKFLSEGSMSDLADLSKHQNKRFVFIGMVTEAEHRTTKTGKPFGSFVLEDYDNNHKFMLFGNNYAKYKGYLTKDWFVCVTGFVKENKWKGNNDNQPNLEFEINDIQLLSDMLDKHVKGVKIKLELNRISPSSIEVIEQLALAFPGKKSFKFIVFDKKTNFEIELLSRKYMVETSKLFFSELEKMDISFFAIRDKV